MRNHRDALLEQLAGYAADNAVHKGAKHKSKGQQLAAWQSHFDAAFAALIAFEEIVRGRVQRREARFSDN